MVDSLPPGRPSTADPDALWTYGELAEFAQVPERTVRQWVYQGKGPRVTRMGRHARIRVRDVLAWLDARAGAA